jgi:purine-nucleoside phosphorylase
VIISEINETARKLQSKFGTAPSTAIILGSGLGALTESLDNAESAAYGEVGLPQTGVAGHAGRIFVGEMNGKRAALLSGRVHVYEGGPISRVVHAVRSLVVWGVKRIVLTNAAGALDVNRPTGSLMLMKDHINYMGVNPLVGANVAELGTRFPDMSEAYTPELRKDALDAAKMLGITLTEGVYVATTGPSYETPAEIRMFATFADAVGMSTAPEAIALSHMGIPIMGVCMISNPGAGLGDSPLNHEEVRDAAKVAGGVLAKLLTELVGRWS